MDRVLEVDSASRAALHPGGGHRAAPGGAAARARTHAAALPAVVRVLDSGRLDRHARRRPLRDAVHPHRRLRRVAARAHAARLVGEPAAAGLRGRAEPRPHADRLRGHPRRDHRGMDARAGPPRFRASAAVLFDDVRGGRAGGARAVAVGPPPVELPAARPGRGRAHRRGARRPGPARARLRIGRPRAGRLARPRARAVRRPRRRGRVAAASAASPRAPGAMPSSRLPTCATRSSPRASSPRPSRRRSRGTASSPWCDGVRAGAPRGARRPGRRDLPADARLPGRRRALLHGARAGSPRRGAGAVGGAEGGGVRGDRRRGRHHHAPPRGRPRPQAVVRPPAPRPVRRQLCAPRSPPWTRRGSSTRAS